MKKICLLAIVATLFMVSTSCNKSQNAEQSSTEMADESSYKDSPAMKLLESVEFTKEGLVSMIKSKTRLTDVEYEALLLAYSKVGIDKEDLTLDDNPIGSARDEIFQNHELPDNAEEVERKLLTCPYPQVRGYIMGTVTSLFGVSDANIKEVMQVLKKEKDPYVIKCGIDALSNEMKNADVAEYILSKIDHESAPVREECANAIGNSWSEGVKGVKEATLKLMADKDLNVKKAIYSRCGKLYDESLIPELSKVLNDPNQSDLHSDAMESLYTMWYDFPFHEHYSKAAFDATIAYLKKTPRSEEQPYWTTVGRLQHQNSNKYPAWAQKATYFKPKEFVAVMVEIAKDANANWLGRNGAVKVIAQIGSKDDLRKLKQAINANAADSKKDLVLETIDENL